MSHTLFLGHRRLAAGTLTEMTAEAARLSGMHGSGMVLLFEDASGRQVDVDLRGEPTETPNRGPGRPRLGVVAKEVTLLPHHWEWLAAQPGGASVTLRKLVEHARKAGAAEEKARNAREAAYRFLYALAGNLPEYEEVTRALFAGDLDRMRTLMLSWPTDVREHALSLAKPD